MWWWGWIHCHFSVQDELKSQIGKRYTIRSLNPPLCQCGNVLSQVHSGLQCPIWLQMTQKLAKHWSLLFSLKTTLCSACWNFGKLLCFGLQVPIFIAQLPVNISGRLKGFLISCNWTFLRRSIRLDWFTSSQTFGKWSVKAEKLYRTEPIETNTCRGGH